MSWKIKSVRERWRKFARFQDSGLVEGPDWMAEGAWLGVVEDRFGSLFFFAVLDCFDEVLKHC
jgi:hypothetical protein